MYTDRNSDELRCAALIGYLSLLARNVSITINIVANGGVCCPERWAVRSLHLVGLLK